MSDDELVSTLRELVEKQKQMSMKTLADAYAGKIVDPFELDLLRDYLEEEEVDELEEMNEQRRRARAGR